MFTRYRLSRSVFFLFLLACLLAWLVGTVQVPVKAASSSIVISQVYGGGGNTGATYQNDFVELFNLGSTTVSLAGWSVQYAASGSGSTPPFTWGTVIPLSGSLMPGQYYLVQLGPVSATGAPLPTPDATGTSTMAATAGKVALVNTITPLTDTGCPFDASVVDFVGYGGGTNCFEGATSSGPSNNSTSVIRSNNCSDTDNNSIDFSLGTPNPHNTASTLNACLRVSNVSSTTADSPPSYITGNIIPITVTFSNNVNVNTAGGVPYLLLETGANDAKASYVSGSGTSTLTFNYIVGTGDTSGHLDYVDTNSLVLNGGTIVGAVGNAILTLFAPGTGAVGAGSLGINKNIAIDNQVPPTVTVNQASTQIDPSGVFPIDFTVVFSEPINTGTFTPAVITQNGSAPGVSWLITDSGDHMNFTLSATGALGIGTIRPLIAANQVTDVFGNGNIASTSTDNTVTYNNTPVDVTIEQAVGQADPTGNTPINFTVVFSNTINPSTFTAGDIVQNGTATGVTWQITDSGDHKNFTLSAIAITDLGITTIQPSLAGNTITDTAGNGNNASTSVDNLVTFDNSQPPSVTIVKATGQADPTTTFPINFSVTFSKAINVGTFAVSDIAQNGTATGVTWSIVNSGDNTNFALSATSATSSGTIFPYIAANSVLDLTGNNNTASSSVSTTSNTVIYDTTRPTVTVNQAAGQADPTSILPINFTVVFSEPINVATFTTADIIQAGTASGIVWMITDSGDHMTFTLSAVTMTKNGTLIPAIGVNRVTDLAGNNNFASTSTDNSVTCTAIVPTPTSTPTATPTATPTLGVFISEVAWMGTTASSSDEWVELYNSGPIDVDLSNWTLKSVDGSINIDFLPTDANHIIKSHEFFILARAGTFTDVVIDKTITASFNNSGESLQLRNNLGVLIDTANSNGGSWPAGVLATSTKPYGTMERHNGTALDVDVNWYTFAGTPTTHDRNGNLVYGTPGYINWAASVIATPSPQPTATRKPTPTRTPAPPPPGPLIAISEFVPRPGHDWNQDGAINTGDEYIEIINYGVIPVNLGGYFLDDEANIGSSPFSLPSKTLQPGERIVFYGSETGLLLNDSGDGVRLLKSGGQLVDAYNYTVAKYPDQTYCRLPDNGGLDDWSENCSPSPGLRNKPGTGLAPDDSSGSVCPIADSLPRDFVLAECPSIGNTWSRYYWDQNGWLNEMTLPNLEGEWDAFVD